MSKVAILRLTHIATPIVEGINPLKKPGTPSYW